MSTMSAEVNTTGKEPVELLKSGQVLAVCGSEGAGLIIQKPFFAEYVGTGAAIGGLFDLQCVTVYTLGEVTLTVPEDKEGRQSAFQKRIEDIEAMQELCQLDSPLERGVKILTQLCSQYDTFEVKSIPNDVLAKLVGVLPSMISEAWGQVKYQTNQAYSSTSSGDSLQACMAGAAR